MFVRQADFRLRSHFSKSWFSFKINNNNNNMFIKGVTTDEIDKKVHQFIVENDAYPSPLNYHKFPKSLCTSINEVICHGIPDSRPL